MSKIGVLNLCKGVSEAVFFSFFLFCWFVLLFSLVLLFYWEGRLGEILYAILLFIIMLMFKICMYRKLLRRLFQYVGVLLTETEY